jgi:(E)-2-((N-methylformamido)methylene)succinate hydrolase
VKPAKIAYRRSGRGPAVLLIHGVGGDASNWDAIAARLAQRFDVIAMDLRGHGRSDLIEGPLDAHDLARDALQVLDECHVATCAVVGMSLGGAVAMTLALDAPERVRELALIATVCGRTPQEQAKALERVELCRQRGHGAIAEANRERWFTDAFRAAHPDVVEHRVGQVKACDATSYLQAFTVFCTTDLVDRLADIKVPTLIIAGEHDVAATPRMAALMAERIANAHAHVLPQMRHSLLIEAGPRVTELLESFLQRDEPATARRGPSIP